MKKINAILIDDELDSIDTLQWKLNNYCPDVEVVGTFSDPVKGLERLKTDPPQLLFLDIEMPMLNGFDVLQELGQVNFDVIFTTAYDNFGIQAVKFSALDYLLKPIQNSELKNAVEKYLSKNSHAIPKNQLAGLIDNVQAEVKGKSGRIALATKESIEFVDPREIVLCSSDSNYTMVFLNSGRKKLISRTLKEFEDMLAPFNFYRPHNSHLINLAQVREFVRTDGGYLVMDNQMKVPVSRSRKEHLLLKLQ